MISSSVSPIHEIAIKNLKGTPTGAPCTTKSLTVSSVNAATRQGPTPNVSTQAFMLRSRSSVTKAIWKSLRPLLNAVNSSFVLLSTPFCPVAAILPLGFVVFAEHIEEFQLGILGQKLLMTAKPLFLIGHFEVAVKIRARGQFS
jgi:hypothetical protein